MSLRHHPLHEGSLLRIACVCCTPDHAGCGALEHAGRDSLALPLRGVFVKHHEGGAEVVAHAGQALFFNADEGYRVSHPAGGDDCLTLEAADPLLRELLARFDAPAAERERHPFRATHASLPAAAALQRGLLWHALRHGGPTLEIETRALDLFAAALAHARPQAPHDEPRGPRARRRRREQAQAVALRLAAQPERDWSLDALARQVAASPFHLARGFRATMGEPIHRYLLRVRLVRALDAVLDSSAPLAAIALDLGFATPSHFAEAFRRAYGCAPSALRRQARAAQVRALRKIPTAPRRGAG
ncbi:helix-turn-helix transcriptional regulator [Fulvimonas soli]|jgi:AraC-like DNA-binding protein|uniref:AraC family transcriptional regulator n=1 Tax=Fulvimonas soli TaxID=155197 RepID=A0A316HWX0_9GAMM|nr:helix-turn-helix transcriptional regulator [Fulvimonas soli]PWK85946.1 AraC family transcriptional regulator [Fulvimonas soli]TNY26695.1 hypothetical protein BV497_07345 [Fulvimonas soli]